MKTRVSIRLAVITGIAALGLTACDTIKEHHQQKLISQAQVTRSDAEKAALAKVPGTIKKGEIEKEKGRLMWSFDVIPTGSTEVTEVEVDAKTGDIIEIESESGKMDQKK